MGVFTCTFDLTLSTLIGQDLYGYIVGSRRCLMTVKEIDCIALDDHKKDPLSMSTFVRPLPSNPGNQGA